MSNLPALTVDVRGLAQLVERRGKSFAVLELIQNAWDEEVTEVAVTIEYVGRGKARLVVEDDSPEGFRDLSHAYTMFAPSYKKDDPEKRGRFNIGEKLVVALSDEVEISTTKGGVRIDVQHDSRTMLRKKRAAGTVFAATLRMSEEEVAESVAACMTLIPPPKIATTVNGRRLAERTPLHTFVAKGLQTERADADGFLRKGWRPATVEVYEPFEGETATLYELGLPVVETGDAWHVNVLQKVPLNTDRDNVTPGFLRDIRARVLNAMADSLDEEQAAATWVDEALTSPLVEQGAVEEVLTQRFGEKRVVYDPSDPEANKLAVSKGYTVIHGGALSREAWSNVRKFDAAQPAGQVTPSPKPYDATGTKARKVVPEKEWTDGMRRVADYARMVATEVLGFSTSVTMVNDSTWPYAATYGAGRLTFNVGRLGYRWFEREPVSAEVASLVIHEFGHQYSGDHLSHEFHDALCRIGARTAEAALTRPELFSEFRDS